MELRPSFVAACSFLRRALRRCCPLLLAGVASVLPPASPCLAAFRPPPVGSSRARADRPLSLPRSVPVFVFIRLHLRLCFVPAFGASFCPCFFLPPSLAPLRHVPAALPRSCLLSARSLFRAAALPRCPPPFRQPSLRSVRRLGLLGLPECRCRLPRTVRERAPSSPVSGENPRKRCKTAESFLILDRERADRIRPRPQLRNAAPPIFPNRPVAGGPTSQKIAYGEGQIIDSHHLHRRHDRHADRCRDRGARAVRFRRYLRGVSFAQAAQRRHRRGDHVARHR